MIPLTPTEVELQLHSTTKSDHRAQYRPNRRSNHCQSEGYLRPNQAAQSIYFEYINDFKRPTIRAVHERRLKEHPLSPPDQSTRLSQQQTRVTTPAPTPTPISPTPTSPTSKNLVDEALAYVDGVIIIPSIGKKSKRVPSPYLATKQHIVVGANVE
jgi:hypothetical protein